MKEILEKINNSKKIAILSHINPDADALCSSIALKNIILNNFDFKQVDVFVDGNIGDLYDPIVRNEAINPTPFLKYDFTFSSDIKTSFFKKVYHKMLFFKPLSQARLNICHNHHF